MKRVYIVIIGILAIAGILAIYSIWISIQFEVDLFSQTVVQYDPTTELPRLTLEAQEDDSEINLTVTEQGLDGRSLVFFINGQEYLRTDQLELSIPVSELNPTMNEILVTIDAGENSILGSNNLPFSASVFVDTFAEKGKLVVDGFVSYQLEWRDVDNELEGDFTVYTISLLPCEDRIQQLYHYYPLYGIQTVKAGHTDTTFEPTLTNENYIFNLQHKGLWDLGEFRTSTPWYCRAHIVSGKPTKQFVLSDPDLSIEPEFGLSITSPAKIETNFSYGKIFDLPSELDSRVMHTVKFSFSYPEVRGATNEEERSNLVRQIIDSTVITIN